MTRIITSSGVVEISRDTPVIIGRDPGCAVRLGDPRVSRRHATLVYRDDWILTDQGSTNGTFVDGLYARAIPVPLGAVITLGQDPDSPRLVLEASSTSHAAQHPPASPSATDHGNASRAITYGRDRSNTVVIDSLLVSRFHCTLEATLQGLLLTDLGSFNGTFVNGVAVRAAYVQEGDIVAVADVPLVVREGRLQGPNTCSGEFHAQEITFDLPGGKRLLDQVDFTLAPSTLTAVIGPSGAGKSTLFRILTGAGAPTSGAVEYEGYDLFQHYAHLRHRIGVVPQEDVIHRQLTVHRALNYAAEFRFPPDLPPAERQARVDATVAELQLTGHAQTPVSRLSGGQRKRTSVAMELLTEPSLLFLDEPTSGLDPGLDKMVMATLRTLADGGRTVMVITHSVANLGTCDNVLVLAPGGKVVYFGPPGDLLEWFGTEDYADVFNWVTEQPERYQQLFSNAHPIERWSASTPQLPPPAPSGQPFLRQLSTVARRQVRIMASDRSFAVFNGLLPLVLGLLSLAVPGKDGLSPPSRPSSEAMQILVILVVGATFMGMSSSVRDLVGERPIFLRERAVGLSPGAYLAAKVAVFGTLSGLQTAVLLVVLSLGKKLPTAPLVLPVGVIELYVGLALTAFVGALVGLAISSVVSTNEQVMPLLVVSVMTQLVLCGGLIPVAGRAGLEQLAFFAPSRWGYAASAASVDVMGKVAAPMQDALWEPFATTWLFDLGVLLTIGVAVTVLTASRLRDARRVKLVGSVRGGLARTRQAQGGR